SAPASAGWRLRPRGAMAERKNRQSSRTPGPALRRRPPRPVRLGAKATGRHTSTPRRLQLRSDVRPAGGGSMGARSADRRRGGGGGGPPPPLADLRRAWARGQRAEGAEEGEEGEEEKEEEG
ncbi:unnamed protein product, partial [Prorocentrum cordatum]